MTALIVDLVESLGRTALPMFWMPLGIWTVLALPVAGLASSWKRGPVLLRYRLLQGTLLALPVGVLASAFLPPLSSIVFTTVSTGPVSSTVPVDPSAVVVPKSAAANSWPPILFRVMGVVTLAVAVAGLVGILRFVGDIRESRLLPSRLSLIRSTGLDEEADRAADELGVRRPVRVRRAEEDVVPMTFGTVRPTVVLPATLQDTMQRKLALHHELIHIRRYDDVSAACERLLRRVAGFHPLVPVITGFLSRLREQACDAAVLTEAPGDRASYADLLVSFAEHRRSLAQPLCLSESPSSLKTRLQSMTTATVSLPRTARWFATGTLSLLLIVGVTACSDSIAPDTQQPAAETQASSSSATTDVIADPDTPPKPRGGLQAIYKKLEYPELVAEAGIEGRVFVQFVVDASGSVTSAEAVSPTNGTAATHDALEQAAIQAVKRTAFEPGTTNGEPVASRMTLPVTFRLNGASTNENGPQSAALRSAPSDGGRLFDKAGIQILEVLINMDGDVLLNREPVSVSNLAEAARKEIQKDAARAFIIPDENAPPEAVQSVEAQLRTLSLQKVYREVSDS